MPHFYSSFLFVVLSLSLGVCAQDRPTLGILDARFVGHADDAVLRDLFTSAVRGKVVKLVADSVDVIEGDKLDRLIQVNATSCSNASCLAQFARKAGLDYLLETKLTFHKGKWTASLKLASARSENLLDEEQGTYESDETAQSGLPVLASQVVKVLVKGGGIGAPEPSDVDNVPLAPPPAGATKVIVSFESDPSGSAVSVDGKISCTSTPCKRPFLRGAHRVELVKDGYHSRKESVSFQQNGQRVSWSLSAIQTRLSLDAVDDRTGDALIGDVYVDGVKVGQTPFDGLVAVSASRIEVAPGGFDRQSVSVSLEEGKTASAMAHFRGSVPAPARTLESVASTGTPPDVANAFAGIDLSRAASPVYDLPLLDVDGKELLDKGRSAFLSAHKGEPERIGKAFLMAAAECWRKGDVKSAQSLYDKLIDWWEDNRKSVSPSFAAEGWYALGCLRSEVANRIKVGGEIELHASSMRDVSDVLKKHTKAFVESIKERSDALKSASEAYEKAIDLQDAMWAWKARVAMADNDYKLAVDAYTSQPAKAASKLDFQLGILYRSSVGGSIPTLIQKAAKAYCGLLDLAYASNAQETRTKASQRFLRCYIIQGLAREMIGDAIASEPCPSTAKEGSDQYNEECEYHKAQKKDKQKQFQKAALRLGYEPGLEMARKYGISGVEVDALAHRIEDLMH